MAGLIRREDIDEVRSRSDIREIVEGFVTLKSAGIGSYKGLCPFHDERTPSFHVRPQMGTYHCFGCGESGDVIAFLMAMEHTSFAETVERLAARIGYELHYEQGSGPTREEKGRRQRLIDAHKIAQEFFERHLYTRQAQVAQAFLGGRGFDGEAAKKFGVGFAPQGWSNLLKHLRDQGFSDEELKATGMFSEGQRGLYDRFRGRLIWPIRNITGETIGFGARKLFDDDQGPKYLNTPETQLYKKSQVLYGIDLAKRKIAQGKQIMVVEGYTDVMAAHLAGIETAVATCGTSFGTEHIKIVRRLLGDDGSGGEVIFTFDGDEAGQKAALHAFQEDQRFTAQTYVCVAPDGMDPCDLRLKRGDRAVRDLLEDKRPLFEFAIRVTLRDFDLDSIEGRYRAMKAVAPMVASIRDSVLRHGYQREVSRWIGVDLQELDQAVQAEARKPSERRRDEVEAVAAASDQGPVGAPQIEVPDYRDPAARRERQALEVLIQVPELVEQSQWDALGSIRVRFRVHYELLRGILAAAGEMTPTSGTGWINAIRGHAHEATHGLLAELTVAPLPASSQRQLEAYAVSILNSLLQQELSARQRDKVRELERVDAVTEAERFRSIQREIADLEYKRRQLSEYR
ncbi:DNA primase [uncultured Kocuria sp.]|uniref:DNA primase n=1 Tax=uncultured Kocuria sp. TaxID=259305 RepID=UPI002593268E|nr:DNA primase [uncultured Kocuria sp.]MCT1366572.1 DNA primase [Rothia sp. p3-SID1597]